MPYQLASIAVNIESRFFPALEPTSEHFIALGPAQPAAADACPWLFLGYVRPFYPSVRPVGNLQGTFMHRIPAHCTAFPA